MTVLTIGHSTRALDALLSLLRAHGVDVLVDVRRHPGSRRLPHFSRESLVRALPAAGIAYEHAEALGGRRQPRADSPNAGWRNPQFRGYADHMATPEFAEALHRFVLEPSRDRVVAVMCAEAVPWRCHRSLLADALVARGVAVKHVIDESEPRAHTPTPFAVVDDDATVRYPAPQQQLLP